MVMALEWEARAAAVALAEQLHKQLRATLAEPRRRLQLTAAEAVMAGLVAPTAMGARADKQRRMRKEATVAVLSM